VPAAAENPLHEACRRLQIKAAEFYFDTDPARFAGIVCPLWWFASLRHRAIIDGSSTNDRSKPLIPGIGPA
jgi:hypothetical protein